MKELNKKLFDILVEYKAIKIGDLGDVVLSINRAGITDIKWGQKKIEICKN